MVRVQEQPVRAEAEGVVLFLVVLLHLQEVVAVVVVMVPPLRCLVTVVQVLLRATYLEGSVVVAWRMGIARGAVVCCPGLLGSVRVGPRAVEVSCQSPASLADTPLREARGSPIAPLR